VTTNVIAKPVTFLHEINHCCTVVSHTCSCLKQWFLKQVWVATQTRGRRVKKWVAPRRSTCLCCMFSTLPLLVCVCL